MPASTQQEKKMKTINQARHFASDQLQGKTPVSDDSTSWTCWSYGHCEIEELLDFIYETDEDTLQRLKHDE